MWVIFFRCACWCICQVLILVSSKCPADHKSYANCVFVYFERETMRWFVQMRDGSSSHTGGALSSNRCLLPWSFSGLFLLPVLEDACPPRTVFHKGSTLVKPGEISFMKMGNDLWRKSTFQILVQTMGIILSYLAWQQSLACLASKPPSVREIFRHRKKSWWQRPCHHDIKHL